MEFKELKLPNGLVFRYREGTSDANSAIACASQDEYGMRGYALDGKLMFDVGAHVGGVGILAASLGARVVAVEPVPENAALVRENAALNGLRVDVVEAAAGAPGGMRMSYGWHGRGAEGHDEYDEATATVHAFVGNTGIAVIPGYEPEFTIDVPTVTMQDLVDRYGLPDVVKLDCEGGEWYLLSEPVTASIPVIVGEYHPWVGDAVLDQESYFADNRAEVSRRLGATHELSFDGPDGCDAGHFLARKR